MPEIQNPEIVRNIEKAYGLKGYPGPGIISPEIVPVTIVDSLLEAGNIDLSPWQGYVTQAASAGKYSTVSLENPPNSGKIVILERFYSLSDSHTVANMRISIGASLTNISTAYSSRDTRRAQTVPTADLSYEDLVGAITPTWKYYGLSTAGITIEGPWILAPNASFYVQSATVNDGFMCNFMWSERPETVEDDLP